MVTKENQRFLLVYKVMNDIVNVNLNIKFEPDKRQLTSDN
jgi:hypothetical protein